MTGNPPSDLVLATSGDHQDVGTAAGIRLWAVGIHVDEIVIAPR